MTTSVYWCAPNEGSSGFRDPFEDTGEFRVEVGPIETREGGLEQLRRLIAEADPGLTDAAVVVLHVPVFLPADELSLALQMLADLEKPVLVLVGSDHLDVVLAFLSLDADVLPDTTPIGLLAHRLRSLVCSFAMPRDGLTRLANRQAFIRHLEARLPNARPERPVSVVHIDVDHFKRLNDTHGHRNGDLVLAGCARLIRTYCDTDMFAARFAGDEFTIVLRLEAVEALQWADGLCRAVRDEIFEGEIRMTVSAGVDTTLEPVAVKEILARADQALLAAKARGRDQARHIRDLEREAAAAHRNVGLEDFEHVTRVVTERAVEAISIRGQRLFGVLQKEARVDKLTGLFNRRYLDDRLDYEFGEAKRSDTPLTVALIDVDHFGNVNKDYGWPTGDRVLAGISDLIRRNVRVNDWVARYGGEEISVVLFATPLEAAIPVLNRVRAVIEQHPFESIAGQPVFITISVGLAERRAEDAVLKDVMERVSERLLTAKREGRNRVGA